MGPSHQKGEMRVQNPNDYFLSMVSRPQLNSMKVEVNVQSMNILNKWAQNVQKVKLVKTDNIILPKQYKIMERSLCGDSFKLEIQYQCYHILLSQEIKKRSEGDKYLQEAEMWYLVYCLTEVADVCHRLGQPIGDVRPQNLLLNKGGNLKILSSLSVPVSKDIFPEDKQKNKLLLSPEQLESQRKAYKQSHLNYISSQSFSIGMTILSAGILKNLQDCYSYESSELNMFELNKALNFWHQNQFYSELQQKKVSYSQELKNIVLKMVEVNSERRMTSLEVFDILRNHRESIMKLEPFQFKFQKGSPKRKQPMVSNSTTHEGIHMLRSKKASQRSSPQKSQKVEVSSFHQFEGQFSFNTQNMSAGNNPAQQSFSPARKKKISTSFHLSHKKGQLK